MSLFLFPLPTTILSSLFLITMSIDHDSYSLITGNDRVSIAPNKYVTAREGVRILPFLNSLLRLCSVPGTFLRKD